MDVITTPVGKTKNVIWAAYKELVAELKSVREDKTETIAETAKKQSVESAIGTAKKQDKSKLESMLESLITLNDEYTDVCLAIDVKKSELKDVHDIAVEADTYVALIQAKEKIKADKEEEALEIIRIATEKANEVIDNAHVKEQEIAKQIQDSIDEFHQENKRKKEEFDYNFSRDKKQKEDSLADKLTIDGKKLDVRELEIKEREDKASEIDEMIESLNDQIDKLNVERDSEVKKQVAIVENRVKRDKEYEISTLMTKHGAEVSIKDNENNLLKTQIADLKANVEKLQQSVDSASEKVTSIATASLNAQANEGTVDAIMEAVKNSNQTNKR